MLNSSQKMKGILLAGGSGSRLAPMTNVVSKQLLPVYDKPMIYYPLVTLMQANIRDVLLIATPGHLTDYQQLLGTGKQWGIQLHYAEQPSPDGLPQAFKIGADFLDQASVMLLLGDNIFFGNTFENRLAQVAQFSSGATVFSIPHRQPGNYGVVELGPSQEIFSLEEKPQQPKSDQVITGAYIFDSRVVEFAKMLHPSDRGETEMIDLLRCYQKQGELHVESLGEGTNWFDAGTPQMLLEASLAIATTQREQGLIGCPHHTAKSKEWV